MIIEDGVTIKLSIRFARTQHHAGRGIRREVVARAARDRMGAEDVSPRQAGETPHL